MQFWRRVNVTQSRNGRASGALVFTALLLSLAFLTFVFLSLRSGRAAASANTLSEDQMSRMSSGPLAKYVFDNQGCRSCHTVSADGKLGFTERGKELGKGFEGCTSLLTAMNVIAQVPQASRTPDEKVKAARFQQFGCASCHQIVPGTMGLTKYAGKLKSLHLICTEIQCTSCEGEKK
jgi:cytochrome c551/c552